MNLILNINEFMVCMIAITMITMLYKKYMMKHMGLASGVLPLLSLGLGFLIPIIPMVTLKTSPELIYLAGPCSSWLWDALLRYFSKK